MNRRGWPLALVALAALLCTLARPRAAMAQQDPRLVWRTLETPHFHIHYYRGTMEPVARRVGKVTERAAERLPRPSGVGAFIAG